MNSTDEKNIVWRLQQCRYGDITDEAADLIESLQARVEELEAETKQFRLLYPERYEMWDKFIQRIAELEAVLDRLVKASDAARDDLLLRGDVDSHGCRVVNMSATQWDNFCDALDDARQEQGEG